MWHCLPSKSRGVVRLNLNKPPGGTGLAWWTHPERRSCLHSLASRKSSWNVILHRLMIFIEIKQLAGLVFCSKVSPWLWHSDSSEPLRHREWLSVTSIDGRSENLLLIPAQITATGHMRRDGVNTVSHSVFCLLLCIESMPRSCWLLLLPASSEVQSWDQYVLHSVYMYSSTGFGKYPEWWLKLIV